MCIYIYIYIHNYVYIDCCRGARAEAQVRKPCQAPKNARSIRKLGIRELRFPESELLGNSLWT